MENKLMNGLKLVEVYNVKDFYWEWFVIFRLCLLTGIILFLFEDRFCNGLFGTIGGLFTAVSVICLVAIIALNLYHNFIVPTREFKVTCDENVSFLDIEEKYDVIAYDGEIYTIREEVDY